MDEQERKEQFQALLQELDGERRRCEALQTSNEGLEYQVGSQEGAIKSYKPFRDCRSINDVFHVYDNMEGRALAAEGREKALAEAVNNAGFAVYVTDDGRTIIKKWNPTSGVPQQL